MILGLTRKEEEEKLQEILAVAKENLERTERFVNRYFEELKDLQ